MREVLLIDTSVYLVLLGIPGFEDGRESVGVRLEAMSDEARMILPMATIWETGNHVSRLATGGQRYTYAHTLRDDVRKAFDGEAPYGPTFFPDKEELLSWLVEFPDHVKANKSPTKTGEGPSLADVSIIKEWERTCALNQGSSVTIWSLDSDLGAYSRTGWSPS
ncbi:hypothetical protein [Myceligenerans indicum]|uniref:Type II toxin-antitoxin system VapC family toxin n=1 Tax=Myceligenerans indicum TaxID=2593663 RepID=A0ABS1LG79_9MICO|nr:hypothetical protein [Myceligenerans indicum]MBL0885241.1 hypothetical protein [Myceligenerans indicum]